MAEGQYFSDVRKGEVDQLKVLMQNAALHRDKDLQLQLVSRVVAFMTLGMDMSNVFADVIMAMNTRDLVQKKLIYLYLTTYANQKEDIALLSVGTLQVDARIKNPFVRGFALRYLSSLRTKSLLEYMVDPIKNGLTDVSPFVRKISAIGIARLHHLDPSIVRSSTSLIDTLYEMIKDRDTLVICNAISALNDILEDEGGIVLTKPMILYLLNRFHDFNEWGRCLIIDILRRFKPTEDELFDILNLMDGCLSHNNPAVFTDAAGLFLLLTQDNPMLYRDILQRLKAPLLTFIVSSSPEVAFVALKNSLLLVQRHPLIFESDFKSFYCCYHDQPYIKKLKLEILSEVANSENVNTIVSEIAEYIYESSKEIAALSIKTIGKIAIKQPEATSHAIERLISSLELEIPWIVSATMCVMQDVFRVFPQQSDEVLPELKRCLHIIEDDEGKTAVLWMIGEYGEQIDEAPYLLEDMINSYDRISYKIKIELLTSTVKLFFKRPAECKPALAVLLRLAIDDKSNVDLHDRALFFFRLLREDIQSARQIISHRSEPIEQFLEFKDEEMIDRLFEEFNSLAVIYGKPSETFMTIEVAKRPILISSDAPVPDPTSSDSHSFHHTPSNDQERPSHDENHEQQYETYVEQEGYSEHQQDPQPKSEDFPSEQGSAIELVPDAKISPGLYESLWQAIELGSQLSFSLNTVPSMEKMEADLSLDFIYSMASGAQDDQIKFFFFSQDQRTGMFFLSQIVIKGCECLLVVKCSDDNASESYTEYLVSCLDRLFGVSL